MEIIFICTGNASRSPLAEHVLREKLANAGIAIVKVSSAGTLDWGAHPRDEKMVRIAAEHGVELGGETTPATPELLRKADYIVAMTQKHAQRIRKIIEEDQWNKLSTFSRFCFDTDYDVPDPNNNDESRYREVYAYIEKGCERIVGKIQEYSL